MKPNRLNSLGELRLNIRPAYVQYDLNVSGELQRLISNDGLRGTTSHPAVFEKSNADSSEYDADLLAMAHQGRISTEIYEASNQSAARRA